MTSHPTTGPAAAAAPWETPVGRRVVLGAVPAVICLAHFFFGAYLALPSMVLVLASALCLALALTQSSVRGELGALTPLLIPAGLFGAVLIVGFWSLTPYVPGGPHPLWAWDGLSPASSIDKSATVLEMLKLAGLACLFLLGCILGARSDRARVTIGLILALGVAYALVALLLFLTQAQHPQDQRLTGGFYTPNSAGALLGMLTILATSWLLRIWRTERRAKPVDRLTAILPIAAAILLFVACLVLTASRAAIGATVAALVILLIWDSLQSKGSRVVQVAAGVGLLAIAGVIYLLGNTLFFSRFASLGMASSARATIVAAHWRAFLDSPLLGYGYGSYPTVNNQILTVQNYEALSRTVVMHNAYVQWLEEGGLIGAAPMFLAVAVILGATVWRTIARRSNRTLLAGLVAASVMILLHAAFDVSLQTPSLTAFWALLLGLGFAASQAPSAR